MARRDDTDTTVYVRALRADGSEAAPLPLLDAVDLADLPDDDWGPPCA